MMERWVGISCRSTLRSHLVGEKHLPRRSCVDCLRDRRSESARNLRLDARTRHVHRHARLVGLTVQVQADLLVETAVDHVVLRGVRGGCWRRLGEAAVGHVPNFFGSKGSVTSGKSFWVELRFGGTETLVFEAAVVGDSNAVEVSHGA